jgi:glycine/D-amino acid oxidase-like deaminating enzyme
VVLLEAEQIAFGASGRNGGFCAAPLTHGTCSRFSALWGRALGDRAIYVVGFTGLGVGASRFGAASRSTCSTASTTSARGWRWCAAGRSRLRLLARRGRDPQEVVLDGGERDRHGLDSAPV